MEILCVRLCLIFFFFFLFIFHAKLGSTKNHGMGRVIYQNETLSVVIQTTLKNSTKFSHYQKKRFKVLIFDFIFERIKGGGLQQLNYVLFKPYKRSFEHGKLKFLIFLAPLKESKTSKKFSAKKIGKKFEIFLNHYTMFLCF